MKEEEIYRLLAAREPESGDRYEIDEPPVSSEVQQRALDPVFLGEIPEPDGYAHVCGDCGDTMEVFLSISGRRIRRARFDTLGCGFTLACGSVAMEMAEGQTVFDAMRVDAKRIAEALGGLPASHQHCAELASETLRKAIQDYLLRGHESWRKWYRNR